VADEPQNRSNPGDLQKTDGGSVPSPDPTILTTQNLQREILAVRELLEFRVNSILALMEEKYKDCFARFDRQEQQLLDRLARIEAQRIEHKTDTQNNVTAALNAQKELVRQETTASEKAIEKSESTTNKQLEALAENLRTEILTLRRAMDDNKERIQLVDAKANAVLEQKAGAKESQTGLYAAIGAVGVILTIGIAILVLVISN
jgi:hypothetical protein